MPLSAARPAICAARHLRGQHIFGAHLATIGQLAQFLGRQYLLQPGCRLTGLR